MVNSTQRFKVPLILRGCTNRNTDICDRVAPIPYQDRTMTPTTTKKKTLHRFATALACQNVFFVLFISKNSKYRWLAHQTPMYITQKTHLTSTSNTEHAISRGAAAWRSPTALRRKNSEKTLTLFLKTSANVPILTSARNSTNRHSMNWNSNEK